MGIDVTIKNKQLLKKPLKINDLMMGKYECGSLDDYWRNTGELEEGYNVMFDPGRIGRGVEFQWSEKLKNELNLRVTFFSTKYDIEMFYDVIRNVMHVWKAETFEQDGAVYTEADIDAQCKEQKEFNLKVMAEQEQFGFTTIFGAIFPVDIDRKLIAGFGAAGDEEGYANYLHELQDVDAYYAVPLIIPLNDTEYFGNYGVLSDTVTIFPKKASEPPMFEDPDTGEEIKCSKFIVTLVSTETGEELGTMAFDEFVQKAGLLDYPKYDETHVLIEGISEEKLRELASSDHNDPMS